jgi:hypothetical protein
MHDDAFDVDTSSLKGISELANRQLGLELDIAKLEEQLKAKKEEHRQVSQIDIPEAMAEIGLSEFKLDTGHKITVNPFYNCSIPKDRVDEAMDWLRDNNHGDLIKNTISVDFGRGEDNEAANLKQVINDKGHSYTDKTGVHPQTLRAFVREQVESGQTLPLDLLGVFIGQKTTIKEV